MTDKGPRGIIPLDNTRIGRGSSRKEFKITSANGDVVKSSKLTSSGDMERGLRKKYVLEAFNEEERDLWVRVLQEESSRFLPLNDFFQKLRNPKDIGERPLAIPKPICEGWMKKRSSNMVTWNRRYFVMFPDFDGGGTTLFYYMSQLLAQRMIDFGMQTQQGYLRMRHVTHVEISSDISLPAINVSAGLKSWRFAPEPSSSLDFWFLSLKSASDYYSILHKSRLEEEGEKEGETNLNDPDPGSQGLKSSDSIVDDICLTVEDSSSSSTNINAVTSSSEQEHEGFM